MGSDLYAGGSFLDAGGNSNADRIAKWDGTTWTALESGVSAAVNALVVSGSDVYAGGQFIDAGGNTSADYIAKWDGISWLALGSSWDASPTTLINATVGARYPSCDEFSGGGIIKCMVTSQTASPYDISTWSVTP